MSNLSPEQFISQRGETCLGRGHAVTLTIAADESRVVGGAAGGLGVPRRRIGVIYHRGGGGFCGRTSRVLPLVVFTTWLNRQGKYNLDTTAVPPLKRAEQPCPALRHRESRSRPTSTFRSRLSPLHPPQPSRGSHVVFFRKKIIGDGFLNSYVRMDSLLDGRTGELTGLTRPTGPSKWNN